MKITDYGLSFMDDGGRVEKSIFNMGGFLDIYYNNESIGYRNSRTIELCLRSLIPHGLKLKFEAKVLDGWTSLPKDYNLTDDDFEAIPESEQPKGLWFLANHAMRCFKSLEECRDQEIVNIYYGSIWIGSRWKSKLEIYAGGLKQSGLVLKSKPSHEGNYISFSPHYLLTEADFEKITEENR